MADKKSIKLVVSDHAPHAGAKVQELEVSFVDEHIKPVKPIGARLCGGTTTCLAIVDTE
jgi:hypothetical protein